MVTNATNSTTNYGLPLFIATDKPAWLVDWNNTMIEIDKKLKEIADADSNDEILAIIGDANSGLIQRLNTLEANLATDHATLESLGTQVSTNTSNIATILSSLDNIRGDLTTQNALIQNLDARVTALENA